LIPAIKESSHFKQFIAIDEHFPEFCNDYDQGSSGLLNPSSSNQLFDRPHSLGSNGFSFKIMSDLLNHGSKKANVDPSTRSFNEKSAASNLPTEAKKESEVSD